MLDDANSTIMSILYGVAGEMEASRRLSLERFCKTYTQPLIGYLIHAKRIDVEEAKDLVHDFWVEKMLDVSYDQNLVSKYLLAQQKHEKSSFRSYLAAALNHFWLSRVRLKSEAVRRAQVSLDQLEGWEPASDEDEELFDGAWANHVLLLALERVRSECESEALNLKWKVFIKRILQPIANRQAPPSYAEVAEELGLANAQEVGTAITTFRRIFQRNLRLIVQDYLPTKSIQESISSAENEVALLLTRLSKKGGLQLPLEGWGVSITDQSPQYRLALERLTASSLIQNNEDYRMVWSNAICTPLEMVLDIELGIEGDLTFLRLVRSEFKNRELLNKIRVAAKALGSNKEDDNLGSLLLNRKMYGLIYLAAIALAKLHCGEDISSQSREKLMSLTATFVSEEWIDEDTRSLLKSYQNYV